MEDKQARAAARKQALKELLEGVGMIVLAAVCRLLAGDLNFVEGVTTRYEGQSYMYLMAAAAGLLIVGAVLVVVGLVHLVKAGKSGKDTKQGQ
ncbi:MAG: hypothetical protein HDT33_04150 [Clostridiales bacterium]|nr:hypothetical protein [Clostridiales bacterium]